MKIPRPKEERRYELTYLVPTTLTGTEASAIHDQVTALVAKHKGTVSSKEDWGKKQLAYTIKHAGAKHTEALFTHVITIFSPDKAQAFEREMYLQERIMRHLFVVAEETTSTKEEA